MSKVAICSQSSYEIDSLTASIKRAIKLSGFDLASVAGKNVLLKPNLLGPYPPDMAITTHPNFVHAVAKMFLEAGAKVSIGDSPEGVFSPDAVWKITGMEGVEKTLSVKHALFEASGSVEQNGIRISKCVSEADIIVNLPKFKTHGLTILTLAVKNLFGCVNAMLKTRLHKTHKERPAFSEALVQIAQMVAPKLTIIDGVVGMEGDGPSAGSPIRIGFIVCGTNMHDIDAICCKLVGLEPTELDTLKAAKRLGCWDETRGVEVVGDKIQNFSFTLPVTYTRSLRDWWISRKVMNYLWKMFWTQPVIIRSQCKVCLLCVKSCPVHAISQRIKGAPPKINKKGCFQCMCCHEACPHKSIGLKVSMLAGFVKYLNKKRTSKYLSNSTC